MSPRTTKQPVTMKRYICSKCNTLYEALDKYDLVEHVPHAEFGTDIEVYIESEEYMNVIEECDACWEQPDEVPYEPKDVG